MNKTIYTMLILTVALSAQVAENANSGYRSAESRKRMAGVLAGPDRDSRQKPKELIAALRIAKGSTVADVGAGVGYLLPWLSEAVGPEGKVIAQDIFPDFIEQSREAAAKRSLKNVDFVLGNEKDARLAAASADLILILDAYHHFDYPKEMLKSIQNALRPGGRLIVVDYYKRGFRDPAHIRLDEADAVAEIEQHGFRTTRREPFLPDVQWLGEFVVR